MIQYKNVYDKIDTLNIWVIMRTDKYVTEVKRLNPDKQVYWVPDLAPSQDLFFKFLDVKKSGQWNEAHFNGWYKKQFMQEMKSTKAIKALSKLYEFKNSKYNVTVVCSCKDENMCHRSLIREIMDTPIQEEFTCLVAGSRDIYNYTEIYEKLNYMLFNYRGNVEIVAGGARGVDKSAERYAEEHGYKLTVFNAEWDKYGKRAGYLRNVEMHKYIATKKNRGCICFWDGQSKGTAQNFDIAKEYNNPLVVVKM